VKLAAADIDPLMRRGEYGIGGGGCCRLDNQRSASGQRQQHIAELRLRHYGPYAQEATGAPVRLQDFILDQFFQIGIIMRMKTAIEVTVPRGHASFHSRRSRQTLTTPAEPTPTTQLQQ
jgi:hypothetical protein